MKTILLMLGLTTSVFTAIAQFSYPYKKLASKLQAEQASFTETHGLFDTNSQVYFKRDDIFLVHQKGDQQKNETNSLNKEFRELVLVIIAEEESNLDALISNVELLKEGVIKDHKFKDTSFWVNVKQLYLSEELFNYTFTHVKLIDSILFAQYKDSVESLKSIRYEMKSIIQTFKKDSGFQVYISTKKSLTEINQRLKAIEKFLGMQLQKISDNRALLYREEKKIKQKNELNEINTVPAILSGVTDISVIPVINIFAQRIVADENNGSVFGANLFLASEQSAKDSVSDGDFKSKAAYNMLQPEASKFGFRLNFQKSYIVSNTHKRSENRLELIGGFNYLLKNLSVASVDSTASRAVNKGIGLVHFKGGIEWFPRNVFSCYAMFNYVNVVQNSSVYQQYFSLNKQQMSLAFLNVGINVNLAFTKNQNNIKVGLDFVVNNAQIRKLNNSDDSLIPSLRFVYIPDFGKVL